MASSSAAVTSLLNILDWHAPCIAAVKPVLGRVDRTSKVFWGVLSTGMPRIDSTARIVLTKFFWTKPPSKQDYNEESAKHTISIPGRLCCIHNWLVDGLNRKYAAEDGIEVRQGCHDGGPHQCTVVIVWCLEIPFSYGISIQSVVTTLQNK